VRPQPDWVRIHAEMRRAGVTLLLLWEEYRAGQPDGYGYSRFCDLYAAWRGRLSPTMRQSHPLGERLFVDYAGQTVEIIDAISGEVRTAQIFVAALGASNLTYAEARWTQGLADWIGCHVNAFAFLGQGNRVKEYVTNHLDADSIWLLSIRSQEARHGQRPHGMRRSPRDSRFSELFQRPPRPEAARQGVLSA
jgi:transposase